MSEEPHEDPHMQRRARLEVLRDRFIALNMRSRTLRLTRTTRSGALDLTRLEAWEPRALRAFVGSLGRSSEQAVKTLRLLPLQPTDPKAKALSDDLGVLVRSAQATWQETGARELAVGWPWLEGKTRDGSWLRAPLLLFPVDIETNEKGKIFWCASFHAPPLLNPSLFQTLTRLESVRLTRDLLLEDDDDGLFCVDSDTWASLRSALLGCGLHVEAPEELPKLSALPARDREDRQSASSGSFTLRNHLVLGRFPLWGSTIVSDYEALLESDLGDVALGLAAELLALDEDTSWDEEIPLEDEQYHAVGQGDDTPHEASALDGRRRWQVLPSDTSQDAVFQFLDRPEARGLVVQGPPGTGKSQLISNLIASSVACGERVLLVCQKRAALDVVAQRLGSLGLGDSIALVNDVERDRNTVCASIDASLAPLLQSAKTPKAPPNHTHRDAFERLRARLNGARTSFSALTEPVDGRPPLVTLQEHEIHEPTYALPDLLGFAADVSHNEALIALPVLEQLAPHTVPFAAPHPLSQRLDWSQHPATALEHIEAHLRDTCAIVEKLRSLHSAMTPSESRAHEHVWSRSAPILDFFETSPDEAIHAFVLFWTWTDGQALHGEWNRVMDRLRKARSELKPTPHELITTPREQLHTWIQLLAEFDQLATLWYRFFLPRWWSLRKVPHQVLAVCTSLALSPTPALVRPLDLCRQALPWHDLLEDLPNDNAFLDFGFQGSLDELDDAIEALRTEHERVLAVHRLHSHLKEFGGPYSELPDFVSFSHDPLAESFVRAALDDRRQIGLMEEFDRQMKSLKLYFKTNWADEIVEHTNSGRYADALEMLRAVSGHTRDFARVRHIDTLCSEHAGWVKFFLRHWSPDSEETPLATVSSDALVALRRAWRTRALEGGDARVLEAPLVDPDQLQRVAHELRACVRSSYSAVQQRHAEHIGELAGRAGAHRTMRRLLNEARKRRRRMSLRQLVEAFWERGLSHVKPCWFCSPESVSALFPLHSAMFDLVIFDEASQCPVESAVPALVRAKRVVVAGDDQQMPPSHFFRARKDLDTDADEDSTVLATQSFLAAARVAFRSTTLRWHYRSQHEELIAFSNHAFYNQRLITAPRARSASSAAFFEGLHFVRTDGVWEEQTNEAEAEVILSLVERLLSATLPEGDCAPSVGVITFNLKQMELIRAKLQHAAAQNPSLQEALARDAKRPVTEQLFIRNLENVQGDERDVVLFSVGYGPDAKTGKIHARFGPLGQEGGGKRLNVAITRARLGTYVVASMDPGDLRVENTRNRGPKLLAAFLEYVQSVSEGRGDQLQASLEKARSLSSGHGVTGSHRDAAHDLPLGQAVLAELVQWLNTREELRYQVGLGLGSQTLDIAIGLRGSSDWVVGVDCCQFLHNADDLSRDVYTPQFWTRLGWTLVRVTPRMWAHDRDEVFQRICEPLGLDPALCDGDERI